MTKVLFCCIPYHVQVTPFDQLLYLLICGATAHFSWLKLLQKYLQVTLQLWLCLRLRLWLLLWSWLWS